jgi:hypothetical protein
MLVRVLGQVKRKAGISTTCKFGVFLVNCIRDAVQSGMDWYAFAAYMGREEK